MSVVSAKFIVHRATKMGWATEVELVPDYAHGRNKEWAEATPAGSIRMTIKNDLAAREFQERRAFTVLFEGDPLEP